jgi:hypothetical protein
LKELLPFQAFFGRREEMKNFHVEAMFVRLFVIPVNGSLDGNDIGKKYAELQ